MKKRLKQIWNYIKPSWEGDDGKLSYKRVSQFVFVVLVIFSVLSRATTTQYGFYTVIALLTAFLLVAGIISAEQIIRALSSVKLPFSQTPTQQEIFEEQTGQQ